MKYLYLLMLCSLNALAQQTPIEKIAADCNTADLKKNLYYLASNKMRGRMMGSHEDTLAANYVAERFKQEGLTAPYQSGKSYFQAITALRQTDKMAFAINDKVHPELDGWELYPDVAGAYRNLSVILADYTNVKLFCKDIPKMGVQNKAIFINTGLYAANTYKQIDSLQTVLKNAGAKLLVFASGGMIARIAEKQDEAYLPKYKLPPYFEGRTTFILQDLVLTPQRADELLGGDRLRPGQHYATIKNTISVVVDRKYTETHAPNVIGIIKGTDPNKPSIVISCHHDHDGIKGTAVNYGAVDNASGTAAVMQLATMFNNAVKQGLKPSRTVVFISFTGEERGLLGSQWYVDHPVYPMDKTYAILNIDMFGRTDTLHIRDKNPDSTNYAYILVKDSLNRGLRKALFSANNTTKLVLDPYYENPKYEQRRLMGSDQYPFYLHGVPFIRIDCGFSADYHKITDTPDKINYALLTKQTQLAFLTLWNLAKE
jgi:hypothetical protein